MALVRGVRRRRARVVKVVDFMVVVGGGKVESEDERWGEEGGCLVGG